MVETGQRIIRTVEFSSRRHDELPVEVLARAEIMSRVGTGRLSIPQRPSFHELILMRSSGGSHTVDFEHIGSRPGRLVWVRPGQVEQWNTRTPLDAVLVLSRPSTRSSRDWFPGDRAFVDLGGRTMALAEAIIRGLHDEQLRFDARKTQAELMARLFEALIALFEAVPNAGRQRHLPDAYLAFRHSIEADLGWSHEVAAHAGRIGYSARTISRACQAINGQTAKRLLSERLALEAKRLLVHTDLPAATISSDLGFSEPTNFNKFFVRRTGTTPAAFRRSQHDSPSLETRTRPTSESPDRGG